MSDCINDCSVCLLERSGIRQTEQFCLRYRKDLIQMGAAAQLIISNELKSVLPLENAKTFESANLISKDGKIQFDETADQRREDAIVKILQNVKGITVIVLGDRISTLLSS